MPVDVKRFTEEAAALERRSPEPGRILFYGSSTFTLWGHDGLRDAMEGLSVTNHGFGGSTADDALYYYPRLVRPYTPSALVYYEGDNDLACGCSPAESMAFTRILLDWLRIDFGSIPVVLLGVKKSGCRRELWPRMDELNALYADWAKQSIEPARYVSTDAFALDGQGNSRDELYLEDRLHFNTAGYEHLGALLHRVLRELRLSTQ